jgi:ribosome-binding factor A
MVSRRISRKEILSSCAETGPEDGIDPRLSQREGSRKSVPNRKALQLCSQVAETLAGILAGECSDDLLRGLQVELVTPAPHSGRMRVTLSLDATVPGADVQQVQQRLEQARAWLRSKVAAAIHRRRVPDLVFNVVSPAR